MIVSLWRYCHLLFAVLSSAFLLVASITGVILAIEPISNKVQPYKVSGADELSLADLLTNVNGTYEEILNISRDRNGFVKVSAIVDGDNAKFYIDPLSGKKLGDPIKKKPIFQFATNLHRSLFLKSTGRVLIGLSSFLLFLIVISGAVLITKRQGGVRRFFAPVVRENFSQYHHVLYSRYALIPLLILALTGVFLSLLRFDLIPKTSISMEVDYDNLEQAPVRHYSEFQFFQNTRLSQLRELEYPFSEFIEDYYIIRLKDREVYLNQVTGVVLTAEKYPASHTISSWATVLHTGEGSILWAIFLGLGSLAIPFLSVTGFLIYFKRPKPKIKNKYSRNEAEYVILVGTEGGTTLQFAEELQKALLGAGKKCFLGMMNEYGPFNNMEYLVIATATYGQGEAPATASNFEKLVPKIQPKRNFEFSIVGFGSTAYPHFCQFAHETHRILERVKKAKPMMDVFTVNGQSFEAYQYWCEIWAKQLGLELRMDKPLGIIEPLPQSRFEVLHKTELAADDTFLLNIRNLNGIKPISGDLLSVIPKEGARERLYSIGKLADQSLVISIKKHNDGLCSNYLYQLEHGEKFSASVVTNKSFHFPKNSSKTVLIATGTGIGPFLGMIGKNVKKKELYLYWGARTSGSLALYKDIIEKATAQGKLTQFNVAYSREEKVKIYVQHLIQRDASLFKKVLRQRGVIMICGSVIMQKEVLRELQRICKLHLGKDLSYYQNRNQIKMDCY